MSTTVSYKGQTLTTVSNDTKTLLTEGKYLEDDLTLTDVSGSGATLITKNINANGTYNASSDSADGYSQVTVTVPASAVDSGTKQITQNGNGQDVVGYAAVDVAVPNSYSQSDEGKVVSNGALVAQTAHADVTPTTSDQTIDTTTNDSIKVKGDADLVASNIKKDVEIFGVTGSYEGGGGTDYLPDLVQNTLTSYYNDEITSMKANAFNGNTNLVSIELPNCLTAALNAFSGCTSLNAVKLPKLRNFNGNTCFNGCTSLPVVVFPSLEGVSNTAFQNCSNLTVADLLVSTGGIGGNGVFSNSGLNTLIIRANRVASLGNVGCFNGTPFASGGTGGTIYIPKVLYDALGTGTNDYKAATNWSTIDGYGTITWAAIEGSQYENYYADGTPISS